MEDIDYATVFGIDAEGREVPAEELEDAGGLPEGGPGAGAQEEGGAGAEAAGTEEGPAPAVQDTGGRTPGGAPPRTEGQEDQGARAEAPEEPEQPGGGPQQQSQEDNARFAAARRKAEAERDAAIAKARQDAQAEAQRTIDEAFRNSGLTDPYTKRPITTKAEFDAYRARYEAERKARILKKSGMSDDEFERFVEGLPEVRRAREAQAAAEAAARQAREQQARQKAEADLKAISALDPTIQELKDLTRMENYPRFYELVKRGNTLLDAYKLANYDALTERAAQASRQAAINSAQSKQHLSQTAQRGAGSVSVPADIKAEYLAFNPDATEAEIQQHYNRYMKKQKR